MRAAIRFWVPAVAWAAVILAASSDVFSAAHTGSILESLLTAVFGPGIPPSVFDTLHLVIRKLAHLTEYAILGALNFRAVRSESKGWTLRWSVIAVALAAALAIVDEWHQSFVPSRTPSPVDSLIDTIGASLAQVIVWGRNRRMKDEG